MSSEERLNRTLTDRYTVFKTQLDETVASFSATNVPKRVENAERLSSAGHDLLGILVGQDRPPWLLPVTNAALAFAQHKDADHGKRFLQTAMQHYLQVAPIVIVDVSASYDFDRLYERLRDEGKLPELFDKMIEAITEMIESGAVDSVTVVTALQRLLAVLKANRDGSYVAVVRSLDYARFIGNTCMAFLKKIPMLGAFVEGYEKTLEEMEKEKSQLDEQLRHESLHMIINQTEIVKLQQLPEKQPLLLEAPASTEGEAAESDEANADESA